MDARVTERRPKVETLVSKLDPNEVIRFADMQYVLERYGPDVEPHKSREAEANLQFLSSLNGAPGSKEEIYLMRVRNILFAYARDRVERAIKYDKAKKKVADRYRYIQESLRRGWWQRLLYALLSKVGAITVFATFGYGLAQTLAPIIPEVLSQFTGETGGSFLVTLVSGFIGLVVQNALVDYRKAKVDREREFLFQSAKQAYREAKEFLYNQYWKECVDAWEEYTEVPYARISFHHEIVRQELREEREHERELRFLRLTELQRAWRYAHGLWKRSVARIKARRKSVKT